jgi:exodeoxyribonuclease VII small subunit
MGKDGELLQEMTLEQTFARLEEITKGLEDPQISLEDAFALYKEGSVLLKQAGGKIDLVQKQVRILQEGSGTDETPDFLEEEEFTE